MILCLDLDLSRNVVACFKRFGFVFHSRPKRDHTVGRLSVWLAGIARSRFACTMLELTESLEHGRDLEAKSSLIAASNSSAEQSGGIIGGHRQVIIGRVPLHKAIGALDAVQCRTLKEEAGASVQYRMLSCAEGDAVAECSDAVRTGMSLQTLLCTYIITQN